MAEETKKRKPKTSDKFDRIEVKCPKCSKTNMERIRYSMTDSIPNLIACQSCGHYYIQTQHVTVRTEITDVPRGSFGG